MRRSRRQRPDAGSEPELVEIARFAASFEGEVLTARLRAAGIRSVLFSADAEGWAPHFNLIQGARVMVRSDDLERARDPRRVERMIADRIARVLTRIYDGARSRKALDSAVDEPSGELDDLKGRHYCLLTTYRKSGQPVATPLWFGIANEKLYFQTGAADGKVKRIKRNGEVRVAPSSARGRPLGPPFLGTARVVSADEEADADRWIQTNYGLGRRMYEALVARRVAGVYVEVTPVKCEKD